MKKIFLLSSLLLAFGLFIACGGDTATNSDPTQVPNVELSHNYNVKTPLGITVLSEKRLSDDEYAQIDKGFTEAKTDAIASGYIHNLDPKDYLAHLPVEPCVPSPVQQIPSFKLRVDQYDGSEFDIYNPKGVGVPDGVGIIYAAEAVETTGQPEGNPVYSSLSKGILCQGVLENGMRYFAEHMMIYQNDGPYDGLTYIHNGYNHPLLPQRTPRQPTKVVIDPSGYVNRVADPDQHVPTSNSNTAVGLKATKTAPAKNEKIDPKKLLVVPVK